LDDNRRGRQWLATVVEMGEAERERERAKARCEEEKWRHAADKVAAHVGRQQMGVLRGTATRWWTES
jgi:hypothetical protein